MNSNIQMAAGQRDAARAVMQSEQRFVMSQERLTLALSTGRVAIYDWDVESDRLSIQGPLGEVFGVALEDAANGLPLSSVVEGIHPDDREVVMALIARTVETEEPFEAEYRVLQGGSTQRIVLSLRAHLSQAIRSKNVFRGVDRHHRREGGRTDASGASPRAGDTEQGKRGHLRQSRPRTSGPNHYRSRG